MTRVPLEDRPVRWPQRFLASRPVSGVGVFSYSLYLVHYPIVGVIALVFVRDLDLSAPSNMLVLTVVVVPIVLLVAYAFHVAVERRFMNTPVPGRAERQSSTAPLNR